MSKDDSALDVQRRRFIKIASTAILVGNNFCANDSDNLNTQGFLDKPPHEFLEILDYSKNISDKTDGNFDVTVQPIWNFYNNFFRKNRDETYEIDFSRLNETLKLVDYNKINISKDQINFENSDMKMTLNGIAQGFITDKVSEKLEQNGLKNILVNIGEYRAAGNQEYKSPWKIGIRDPDKIWKTRNTIELKNKAIATSGGYGYFFDEKEVFHHIFSPRNGVSPQMYKSLSVVADKAVIADGLSTGLYSMELEEIESFSVANPDIQIYIIDKFDKNLIFGTKSS